MAVRKAKRRGKKINVGSFVLNCVESQGTAADFTVEDAADAGLFDATVPIPAKKDLRASWWKVDHQGDTGACVGFATAGGVLRWHYVTEGWISKTDRPAPRFIWMANKETDDLTSYPTTFLDSAGTQTKLALRVAQKYGCVLDDVLPMDGGLCRMKPGAFYAQAAGLRIASYHNLGDKLDDWRRWVALNGPILTRLRVDRTWDRATETGGVLDAYRPETMRGGHAVCIAGYTKNHFIIRNSWGADWGDGGFAYASNAYADAAFADAYGATL